MKGSWFDDFPFISFSSFYVRFDTGDMGLAQKRNCEKSDAMMITADRCEDEIRESRSERSNVAGSNRDSRENAVIFCRALLRHASCCRQKTYFMWENDLALTGEHWLLVCPVQVKRIMSPFLASRSSPRPATQVLFNCTRYL